VGPLLGGLGWLAPLGNLAIGGAALAQVAARDRQPERFLDGEAVIPAGIVQAQVDLLGRIAPGLRDEFRAKTDVPVQLFDGPFSDGESTIDVTGEVRAGVLLVTLEGRLFERVSIRYRVDTGFDNV
jgi:hypothetical protein